MPPTAWILTPTDTKPLDPNGSITFCHEGRPRAGPPGRSRAPFTPTSKANPSQHRCADGCFRQHITILTHRATASPPALSAATAPQADRSPSISDPRAEPITRGFFQRARNVYRRFF